METSFLRDSFESAYESGTAPWIIDEPQPAVVELERAGWIRGEVLDPGCGTGENTIHLARLGYDVLGVDFSPSAVRHARANAAARQVTARFEVANAFELGTEPRFDTIVDSALFHIFQAGHRAAYVRGLHTVTRPGGRVHVLALADTGPRVGPQISESVLRAAFGEGWVLEDLTPSRYRIVTDAPKAALLGVSEGDHVDAAAWLARAVRT
ncbi:class I SAM-dependent methyltransferase [Amycolatopsis pigmentata]|uniref:Class I SAM-dependent methyltransferase n=1 Tax=Amycolatopsis pigmentata TaxID=450801 RepID=A0ABW5FNU0_9PSEU